ncbi:MAG: hypothetical protein IT445_08525 [Phycisphaeraceae bacterium]|nr:hypothetical protein [Phycisphaeraceae bacterium]
MPPTLDDIMESASQSLAAGDYLSCERLCVQALAEARRLGHWPLYARILMPLQESRRQKRMIAADGFIRLGGADLEGPFGDWSNEFAAGCIVVTRPFTREHAAGLLAALDQQQRCAEVLFADNDIEAAQWTVRSFAGPDVSVQRPAPPPEWIDRWLSPQEVAQAGEPGPDDWFIDASEALGDAALLQVRDPLGSIERIQQLESMLAVATDHELLHQGLFEAAFAMRQAAS